MCLRFVFLLITRASSWLQLSRHEEFWKTAEILILRHQLAVLQRQQPRRANLDWADRALLATLHGVIPKARRHGLRLLVTPDTILRWHHDILRRRWAARSRRWPDWSRTFPKLNGPTSWPRPWPPPTPTATPALRRWPDWLRTCQPTCSPICEAWRLERSLTYSLPFWKEARPCMRKVRGLDMLVCCATVSAVSVETSALRLSHQLHRPSRKPVGWWPSSNAYVQ